MASPNSVPKPNKRVEYYPLWRHVQKVARCGGGGSWEWKCTLCSGLFKGSYPRVKAHLLHETGKGVDSCPVTRDPVERRKYHTKQDEADRTKRRHDMLSNAAPPAPTSDLRIVQEARKRRGPQQIQEATSKLVGL